MRSCWCWGLQGEEAWWGLSGVPWLLTQVPAVQRQLWGCRGLFLQLRDPRSADTCFWQQIMVGAACSRPPAPCSPPGTGAALLRGGDDPTTVVALPNQEPEPRASSPRASLLLLQPTMASRGIFLPEEEHEAGQRCPCSAEDRPESRTEIFPEMFPEILCAAVPAGCPRRQLLVAAARSLRGARRRETSASWHISIAPRGWLCPEISSVTWSTVGLGRSRGCVALALLHVADPGGASAGGSVLDLGSPSKALGKESSYKGSVLIWTGTDQSLSSQTRPPPRGILAMWGCGRGEDESSGRRVLR